MVPNVQIPQNPTALRDAFGLLRLWHDARQAGFLADFKQRQVTCGIIDAIFATICGKNWAEAEQDFANGPTSQTAFQELVARVDKRTHFGKQLSKQSLVGDAETAVATRFAALAARHGVSHDRDLCSFALRFATHPLDILSDPLLNDRIALLAQSPTLLRGARLLSLLRQQRRNPPVARPSVSTRP